MKKARMNISHFRFLFKLKIFGEIVTTLNNCLFISCAIKLCVDALCFRLQIRLDIFVLYCTQTCSHTLFSKQTRFPVGLFIHNSSIFLEKVKSIPTLWPNLTWKNP